MAHCVRRYLTTSNYDFNYDRAKNLRPKRNIKTAMNHGAPALRLVTPRLGEPRTPGLSLAATHMAPYKPINPTGFNCVNVLVQRAIGKVKTMAKNRARPRAPYTDKERQQQKRRNDASYIRNRQKIIANATQWNKVNKQRRNIRLRSWANNYMKERKATDPGFHLRCKLRARMYHIMKRTSSAATESTSELMGCSYNDLHDHLAQMVDDEETVTALAIDHIFPMAIYDALQSSTHKKMCNYTNLQPLTQKENKHKSDKLPTKAMAARVDPACWPDGITMDMLPDIYPGWRTPLRM